MMTAERSTRTTVWMLAAAAAWLAVAACRAPVPREIAAEGPISQLAIPDASNTSPSLSVVGDRVVVVWIATVGDQSSVYAAVSRDDGATFGLPVKVNDMAGDARAGGDQGPRATGGASGDIVVVWTSKLAGTSRIRTARSVDGGRTFGRAVTVSGDALTGARGWASVAEGADGVVHAAWLDGRDAQAEMAKTTTGPHVMRQDLYQAVWLAGGSVAETRIATGVCFCCKTGITVAPDGTTYVAWRHVYPTNLRDMAVAASVDGGRTFGPPVRVSEDHWQVAGCPEDGPAIAADQRNVLHIVWPTMDAASGRKGVFHSTSADRGQTFAPRTQLGANAAHPQVTTLGDGIAAVWDEDGPSGPHVKLAVIEAPSPRFGGGGAQTWPSWILGNGQPGSRPSVAVTPRAIVVGWMTQVGTMMAIRVQQIPR